jgi:hypothetical protein
MARMIPDINPLSIENAGERRFYQALQELPDDFTVCYSFRYQQNHVRQGQLGETDFVIVHPRLGYAAVEVKQGEISYRGGIWYEFKNGRESPLHNDPLKQAREAMFAILEEYRKRSGQHQFPLEIRYALCFPESTRLDGILPPDLKADSLFLFKDVENTHKLTDKIMRLFALSRDGEREAADFLINKVLAPAFKIFSRLEDEIEYAHAYIEKVLTREQERILTETELDHRKIFLGAAGSGKTFIAMEKARRLTAAGQKVFVTCFNKNLASYLKNELPEGIFVSPLHDFFLQTARRLQPDLDVPYDSEERSDFFTYQLPALAFDYLMELPEAEKFDAVIVDEGQDLKIEWFDCLEATLKKDGGFYIFADPAQSIFHHEIEEIKKMPVSKHQLTMNLRNTGTINDWITAWLPGKPMTCKAASGFPVHFIPYSSLEVEYKLIEKEIGRLVSQGVSLQRILILSPHIYEKSCLAGANRIKEWPLVNSIWARGNVIRFSTIRSFKGLEADIVFLIDITPESRVCTDADIYVGGSRARFMLYIFHHKDMEWSG